MNEYIEVGKLMFSLALATGILGCIGNEIENKVDAKKIRHQQRKYKKLKMTEEYAEYVAIASAYSNKV